MRPSGLGISLIRDLVEVFRRAECAYDASEASILATIAFDRVYNPTKPRYTVADGELVSTVWADPEYRILMDLLEESADVGGEGREKGSNF